MSSLRGSALYLYATIACRVSSSLYHWPWVRGFFSVKLGFSVLVNCLVQYSSSLCFMYPQAFASFKVRNLFPRRTSEENSAQHVSEEHGARHTQSTSVGEVGYSVMPKSFNVSSWRHPLEWSVLGQICQNCFFIFSQT